MSKQRILMVVAICFVLMGTVAAGRGRWSEPKPDSIVACVGAVKFVVSGTTFPPSIDPAIDENECEWFAATGDNCSICIRSLEQQGCEVLDIDAINFTSPGKYEAVFVLSCDQP
jgi:hypothetical protein